VITGMEMAACQHLAVPAEVMQNVESGYNPFAIGVVGGQLVRQPQNLGEAVATAQMLESKGYNYSLGLAQVNRSNLSKYGLTTYQQAFDICPNLTAGARILSECYASSGNDWGKSFSCYYSGNFVTCYRDGYVQKIFDSINGNARVAATESTLAAIPIQLASGPSPSSYGSNNAARAAVMAPDSASYRLAIRSSALDTVAALATKPLVAALAPSSVIPAVATAQAPSATASSADTVAAAQATDAQPASNAAASSDVFEPQVRALGDPPAATAAVASNDPSKKVAAATSTSTPAGDSADVRQGGHDDALVF
jgi:type IV secretion system protein VirB1